MYWALEGLAHADNTEDAIKLIKTKYGALLDQGATTFWEHWDSIKRYYAALSHGWGAAPTWYLTTHILGVQRTAPNSWLVQPLFRGVEWVEGAIPLSVGDLQVSWRILSCGEKQLIIDAPTNSTGNVKLPASITKLIKINDQVIWPSSPIKMIKVEQVGNYLEFPLEGGHYLLDIQQFCISTRNTIN